jgi:hypothetical protein
MLRMSTAFGLLGAAGASAAALAPAATASVRQEPADGARPAYQITGPWEVTLTIQEIQRVERTLWGVFADGMFLHSSSSGTPGVGRWRRTGPSAFTISFRDFLLSVDNEIESELRVRMNATFTSPDTVSVTAVATVFNLAGTQIGTFHSAGTGTRFDD